MRAPEQKVEDHLRRRVLQAGGLVEKFAPIRAGVPDRVVILGGRVHLVELKASTGALRPVQSVFIDRCADRGVQVAVLFDVEQVNEWVQANA